MKNMTLNKIVKACNGTLVCLNGLRDKEIKGAVLDSRKVKEDFLFLAFRGEHVDGHRFISQAFAKGALCVVCEQVPEDAVKAYILVKDVLTALKEIAQIYRSSLTLPIIGITGSVGKTSTKEFIAGVLEQKLKVLKTEGNLNNEIGVPLTILSIRREHEAAVLEMGINHFGEMHRLSKMVRPDICVITNIGQCHLEFLGSREGILSAKSEIFDYMNEAGTVCLNGDDDMLRTIRSVYGKAPVYYGLSEDNDIYASQIEAMGLLGSRCVVHTEQDSFPMQIPFAGEHMVYNALAAAAVGVLLGLRKEEIAAGVASVQALGGRNHVIWTDSYVLLDDCYNANPVSMKAAIDTLVSVQTRTVAILGDMGELGEKAGKLHEEVGRYCVQKKVSLLLCVGEAAKQMEQGAMLESAMQESEDDKGTTRIAYFAKKEELLSAKDSFLQAGDTILIKASHFMGFDSIVEALQ